MGKKVCVFLLVCMGAVGFYGCGGEGDVVEVSDQMPPVDQNPALQEALDAAARGQELTGSQKRLIDDAVEEGIIQQNAPQ